MIIYKCIKYRIKIVRKNLKIAFPDHSPQALLSIEKEFYKHFCILIVEILKMPYISEKSIEKRVSFKNLEMYESYLNGGKSIICCSGHIGNWEWATLAFGLKLAPYQFKELNIYKKLNNSTMDTFMKRIRGRFGAINVEMKQTLRALVQFKNESFCMIIAADQSPSWNELHYYTDFFGVSTPVYLGVEKLAKNAKLPIIFFETKRIKLGYYEVIPHFITDGNENFEANKVTETHVQLLEEIIKENPYNWLWTHNRWKHKK